MTKRAKHSWCHLFKSCEWKQHYHIIPPLASLHWLSYLFQDPGQNIVTLFVSASKVPNHPTCVNCWGLILQSESPNQPLLDVSSFRLIKRSDRAVWVAAPRPWNSLLFNITADITFDHFKVFMKTRLFLSLDFRPSWANYEVLFKK